MSVRGTYFRVEVRYDTNGDAYTDIYTYGGTVACRRVMPDGTADEYSKQSIALTLTNLYLETGRTEQASKMCELAINGNDSQLKSFAYRLKP